MLSQAGHPLAEVSVIDPRVHRAIRLMTANLRRENSLDEVAHSLNLSASRLRHLFKQETGTTPSRHLKMKRMQMARKLLETTFLNIKEVMLKVGFKHRSHFVKGFRELYGLSPLQYRTQFLKAQQNETDQIHN